MAVIRYKDNGGWVEPYANKITVDWETLPPDVRREYLIVKAAKATEPKLSIPLKTPSKGRLSCEYCYSLLDEKELIRGCCPNCGAPMGWRD